MDHPQATLAQILRAQRDLVVGLSECDSELAELWTRLLDAACRLEGVDSGGVYLRAPATGRLTLVAHAGLSPSFVEAVSSVAADAPGVPLASEGEPVHRRCADLGLSPSSPMRQEGLTAISMMPIEHKNTIIAVLNLASHTEDELSDTTKAAAEALAAVVGGAIVRAQTVTALRESEQRYRKLFNLGPDAIVVLQDGHYRYVNCAFTRIFGYTQEDVERGLTFFRLVKPQDTEQVRRRYEDRLAGKSLPQTFQLDLLTKDGTSVPCETSATLIEHGGRPADLVVIRDISERRDAEQERAALQQQLHQAEKMQAIGQLAGGIAHDFNNQLMGIVGYADLLDSDLDPQTTLAGHVEGILTAARRASDLTAQLLAFARKGKYLSVPVDVHRKIGEVVSLLRHSIDKRIAIRQRLDAHPSVVQGDPSQLQNALLNLAINACDAMDDSGGELAFCTEVVLLDEANADQHAGARRYVKISVIDSGCGVDPAIQQRIFEPFFTTKDNGTGMGLAAVFGTVTNHHGTISVESTPGRGSRFDVLLPIFRQPPPAATEANARSTTGESLRVLIVDDEPMVCRVTSAMLARLGHEAAFFTSGPDALREYGRHSNVIDLVILDLMMPEMSGPEVLAELRAINPEVAVLLVSGHTLEAETDRVVGATRLGFLRKPFSSADLAEQIDRLLGARAPR